MNPGEYGQQEAKIRAAVIGLGNIGFKFDLDPLRKYTWSHVSAYTKCSKTRLMGAVEVDQTNVRLFRQHKQDIPVFSTIEQLMEHVTPEVISICTPTETHYDILKELLKYPFLKGIFCEKPFVANIAEAEEIIGAGKKQNVVIAVNHIRRWDSAYICTRKMIMDGKIGRVKAISGFYSGKIFNIGTHLFDAVRMLSGEEAQCLSGISSNADASDPDVSGWLQFGNGIFCTILSSGKREDLIFEIDILGDEGRIKVLENGETIEWYTFKESGKYSGYRELKPEKVTMPLINDRLIQAVLNICSVIDGTESELNCSALDGFKAMMLSSALCESAKNNGTPVHLRDRYAE
jgi:predicted dehydrogenase